eukprot:1043465-Pyramimonas_sp.AAC.1
MIRLRNAVSDQNDEADAISYMVREALEYNAFGRFVPAVEIQQQLDLSSMRGTLYRIEDAITEW